MSDTFFSKLDLELDCLNSRKLGNRIEFLIGKKSISSSFHIKSNVSKYEASQENIISRTIQDLDNQTSHILHTPTLQLYHFNWLWFYTTCDLILSQVLKYRLWWCHTSRNDVQTSNMCLVCDHKEYHSSSRLRLKMIWYLLDHADFIALSDNAAGWSQLDSYVISTNVHSFVVHVP